MKTYLNYILPWLISDSLLICIGSFLPWEFQLAILFFISLQLITLLWFGLFAGEFSLDEQFYFGLMVLSFVVAVAFGV